MNDITQNIKDIKLNFINNSNDSNNSNIVIFQKNVSQNFEESAIAWTVIKNCGHGDNYQFIYPIKTYAGSSDGFGNSTPNSLAEPGQSFAMNLTASGDQHSLSGNAANPEAMEIENNLPKGSINAMIYKDGKLLAQTTNVASGQKASFQFDPVLFIGVVPEVDEGQIMNSAFNPKINTELSLLGIASADIVMTGGGTGPNAKPFTFTLQNVLME